MNGDTIVAPITGADPAAVAWVRLSGPEAWAVAARVLPSLPAKPQPRLLHYGSFTSGDDGFAVLFAEGQSYTGEASAELSVHGSPASVRTLIEACLSEGARIARAGEFTERAFLNGRIDLTRAEAVKDAIEAQTEAQVRHAALLRDGALHTRVADVRERLLDLQTRVEASVDFPEEVGPVDEHDAREICRACADDLKDLLSTARAGRILRSGLRIALAGAPNAGKSSLLNALLGVDRAIVTDVAGTTRDTIEESMEIGGVRCVLTDTAGLRSTHDVVESLGVERAERAISQADLVWHVVDATVGRVDDAIEASAPVWRILNKCDLVAGSSPAWTRSEDVCVSARTRAGLDALASKVRDFADLQPGRPCINARHQPLVEAALEALAGVVAVFENQLPEDLASAGLQLAARSLGEVTGETAGPDLVERIFRDFCVGK